MINKIFNKDFYPTPEHVIDKMMEFEPVQGMKFLEPSAGKGNIVDWLWAHGAEDVIACETDKNLQKLLSGKCRLVCDDFFNLRSEDVSHVNYIVMNPPFADAEKHILHAWDIAPSGCIIIALKGVRGSSRWDKFNRADDLDERRRAAKIKDQLDELIKYNGKVESMGDCFKDAERETDVEVEMVKLYKKGAKSDEWDGYFDLDEDLEELAAGQEGIMAYDAVRDLVNRYRSAVDMWDEVVEKSNQLNKLTDLFSEYGIKFRATRPNSYSNVVQKEEFKKSLQKDAWNYLFSNLKMDRYVTQGVRATINKFIEDQQHIPFTMKNIYRMLNCILQTHDERMEQCISEAFDTLCSFSSDNSTAGEKWRTNLNYMVNRRFIVPYMCEGYNRYSNYAPYPYVNIGYNNEKINDFIKAINYMVTPERKTPEFRQYEVSNLRLSWGQWYNWGEFRVRFYKKGTMHMEFKDEKLWQEFNLRAAKFKKWEIANNARRTNYNKQAL